MSRDACSLFYAGVILVLAPFLAVFLDLFGLLPPVDLFSFALLEGGLGIFIVGASQTGSWLRIQVAVLLGCLALAIQLYAISPTV